MKISVVIPTRNRADLLQQTLATLSRQEHTSIDWEVRVMDNGSTDGTASLCESAARTFQNFSYHRVSEPGLHAGRNAGWVRSRGEIIAFLDDDVILPPGWLNGVAEAFRSPVTMLAGGSAQPEFVQPPPGWLERRWTGQPEGQRILGELSLIDLGKLPTPTSAYNIFGCNFLVRKAVLEQTQGFHPDGMPGSFVHLRGDGETHVSRFVASKGWQSLYHPAAGLRHVVTPDRMSVRYFSDRHFRQGVSDSYTYSREQGLMLRRQIVQRTFGRFCRGAMRGWLDFRFAVAYAKGISFHQSRLRTDPDLRAWIVRPNYLGCES